MLRYKRGDRVVWSHRGGDSFVGTITSAEGARHYTYIVTPDPGQKYTDPMPALEHELCPILTTPEDVEAYLESG